MKKVTIIEMILISFLLGILFDKVQTTWATVCMTVLISTLLPYYIYKIFKFKD